MNSIIMIKAIFGIESTINGDMYCLLQMTMLYVSNLLNSKMKQLYKSCINKKYTP